MASSAAAIALRRMVTEPLDPPHDDAGAYAPANQPYIAAKEPYTIEKGALHSAKEPYSSAKGLMDAHHDDAGSYGPTKKLNISTKKPYISLQKSHIPCKIALHLRKRAIFPAK